MRLGKTFISNFFQSRILLKFLVFFQVLGSYSINSFRRNVPCRRTHLWSSNLILSLNFCYQCWNAEIIKRLKMISCWSVCSVVARQCMRTSRVKIWGERKGSMCLFYNFFLWYSSSWKFKKLNRPIIRNDSVTKLSHFSESFLIIGPFSFLHYLCQYQISNCFSSMPFEL